jgi:hypothetical protein
MTLRSWDSQRDLLWLNSSMKESLNAAVGVKTTAINHTILDPLLVCQNIDKCALLSQMLV